MSTNSSPAVPTEGRKHISVTGAAFIGIGAMIGAGIFALLGETGLSLLLAGVVTIDYIWKRVRPATPVPSAESQLTP